MSLELRNITLTYQDGDSRVVALDDVSFEVAAGEVAMVVGPSGSGKSSLLAVAATLVAPDVGTVVIGGTDTTGMSRARLSDLRRASVGLVFQTHNLLPALTAVEQLQVMGHLAARQPRVPRQQALGLLDQVGLAHLADRRPGELSGGQRQRVSIARALAQDPEVLLVDEPTAALDHERGAEVMDLLRTVTAERSVATVVVTHDTELIRADDRMLVCRDGRLTEHAATWT